MDVNGLINMLTRMVVRRAVDAGVDYAARKGKPEAEMTQEEREQAGRARDLAKRTKEIQKVTRRFWR